MPCGNYQGNVLQTIWHLRKIIAHWGKLSRWAASWHSFPWGSHSKRFHICFQSYAIYPYFTQNSGFIWKTPFFYILYKLWMLFLSWRLSAVIEMQSGGNCLQQNYYWVHGMISLHTICFGHKWGEEKWPWNRISPLTKPILSKEEITLLDKWH